MINNNGVNNDLSALSPSPIGPCAVRGYGASSTLTFTTGATPWKGEYLTVNYWQQAIINGNIDVDVLNLNDTGYTTNPTSPIDIVFTGSVKVNKAIYFEDRMTVHFNGGLQKGPNLMCYKVACGGTGQRDGFCCCGNYGAYLTYQPVPCPW